MRLILEPTKRNEGRYLDIDLLHTSVLPNLAGVRIKELHFTATDRRHLSTFDYADKWILNILMTRFSAGDSE